MSICSWEGCGKPAKPGKKYCPECAKVSRQKFFEMLDQKKEEKANREKEFQQVFEAAKAAGVAEFNACKPTPMQVQQHANPLNDNSPVVKTWDVPDGSCGFAYLQVSPANSQFANWLQKQGLGTHSAYHRAVWVSPDVGMPRFTQSLELRMAWVAGAIRVLQENIAKLRGSGKSELRISMYSRED